MLNSRVLDNFLRSIRTRFRDGYVALNRLYIKPLSIHTINFDDPVDKARHDLIVALVEQMLKATEKRAVATEAEKNCLDIRIEALDRQIDAAVYELGVYPVPIFRDGRLTFTRSSSRIVGTCCNAPLQLVNSLLVLSRVVDIP